MTLNFPAPYQLDVLYTTIPSGFITMPHHFTIGLPEPENPIVVGTSTFTDIEFASRNSNTLDLQTITDALIAAMDNFYPAATDYLTATLYKYEGESYEGQWQAVYEIAGNGAAASASQPAHQLTFTIRTSMGGICRVQFMEDNTTNLAKTGFPTGNASYDAVKDLLIDPDYPFIGQDGGWLVAGNFVSGTQNEKLYKKRYRT